MKIDVHIHLPPDSFVVTKLNEIVNLLQQSKQRELTMAGELDQLEQDVTAQTTVVDSIVTLLAGLKAALDAAIAAGDMSRVRAVNTQLEALTQRLADAAVANTPSA